MAEEDEVFDFGTHDFHAENYFVGRILPHFPWGDLFRAVGIDGNYPAVLYTDARADELFLKLSGQLSSLIFSHNLKISIDLTYQGEGRQLEGVTKITIHDPHRTWLRSFVATTLPASIETGNTSASKAENLLAHLGEARLYTLMLRATVRALIAEESYGRNLLIQQEEVSVAPLHQGFKAVATYCLRLPASN